MYIVLLDPLGGDGLTTFSWGLLTIEEKNLKDYIINAFLEILGYENMEQYLADDPDPLKADGMRTDSFADSIVILSLMQGYRIAEAAGEIGVSNFLQDRIIAHQKHGWMIKATLK